MFTRFINKIRTKEDVYHLVSEIDLLLASLYENGERGFDSTMDSSVRSWVSDILLNEFSKDNNGTDGYLKSLRKTLESLEGINLTLSFEPSSSALDKFSSYLRESTGKDIVLDVQIDKAILGGVTLSYRGIYKDFSVARLIGENDHLIEKEVEKWMDGARKN